MRHVNAFLQYVPFIVLGCAVLVAIYHIEVYWNWRP